MVATRRRDDDRRTDPACVPDPRHIAAAPAPPRRNAAASSASPPSARRRPILHLPSRSSCTSSVSSHGSSSMSGCSDGGRRGDARRPAIGSSTSARCNRSGLRQRDRPVLRGHPQLPAVLPRLPVAALGLGEPHVPRHDREDARDQEQLTPRGPAEPSSVRSERAHELDHSGPDRRGSGGDRGRARGAVAALDRGRTTPAGTDPGMAVQWTLVATRPHGRTRPSVALMAADEYELTTVADDTVVLHLGEETFRVDGLRPETDYEFHGVAARTLRARRATSSAGSQRSTTCTSARWNAGGSTTTRTGRSCAPSRARAVPGGDERRRRARDRRHRSCGGDREG